ncbi:hypothetical protein OUQ49_33090 [Streptomyces cavourensis]|uniref:hypothetical protein n=1 Tax=Streptomyces cavourensis TaxID=67258 RepID=UPI0022792704|nr:hypothetical protein [Streptomyces cavourensis]WAE64230.1 hypothetical protein OUQ49_00005 [Streptomyces cavourensis]WAE70234.1 hypothetical protein OUQ49_33090 [Streptomyces cavourensis]
MTVNRDRSLELAAQKAAPEGPEGVARALFQTLWGLPKFADEHRLRRLEVFRVIALRTWPEGPEAVAAAALHALNGATGDPAAPWPQQTAQRVVQLTAFGLGPDEIRARVAGAWADVLEAQDVLFEEDDEELGGSPDLSARWRHAEWQRLLELVTAGGDPLYEPGMDPQVAAWTEQRREQRRQVQAAEEAARAERAAQTKAAWQERVDELHLELALDAATGRRVRAWAQRYGLTPADIVRQLVQHATDGPGGGVAVDEFTPSPHEAPGPACPVDPE